LAGGEEARAPHVLARRAHAHQRRRCRHPHLRVGPPTV